MSAMQDQILWRGRIFRYAPLILWTGLIFFMSSGAGHTQHTSIFIRPVLLWLFPDMSEANLAIAHIVIRKIGHLTGYAILAALSYRAFSGSSKALFSMVVVLSVATVDEIHQGFYDGRTSSPIDVLIDCAGGASALLLIHLYKKFRKRSV